MKQGQCMAEMQIGMSAVVVEICTDSGLRRRLQDMGLITGSVFTCVGRSPLGDPSAYRIRRRVVALRK